VHRARFASIQGVEKDPEARTMIRGFLFAFALFFLTAPVFGQVDEVSKQLGLGKQSFLSNSKIASGLREALQVGADNAVKLTGRPDGYFGNEALSAPTCSASLNPEAILELLRKLCR